MNKTVTINIAGWVFHIEEEAYDLLKVYIECLRAYFFKMEGGSEVMEDIEARIAEILKSQLGESREVVVNEDVKFVEAEIGKVEDFDEIEDKDQGSAYQEEPKSSEKRRKKLFRNTDEKILGGVCSGVATYIGVDVVWIRLLFILSLFFGMRYAFDSAQAPT